MRHGLYTYDDGVLYYGAERILDGDIPYKDFWFVYTPGNLYALAILFKIFGPSILIARIFNTLICFLLVFVTYLLGKKMISNKIILILLIVLTTLWAGLFGQWANINLPLLFALLSSYFYLEYIERKEDLYLILTGFLAGLTFFFKYDIAVYLFLSITLTLIAYKYNLNKSIASRKKIFLIFNLFAMFLIGFIIVLIPLLTYFIVNVPLDDLISQFITFPTKIYPVYRQFPFPLPKSITIIVIYYFAPLILMITSIWILFKAKKNHFTENCWAVIFLIILGSLFMNYARVSSFSFHMYPAMFPALILFSLLFSRYFTLKHIPKLQEFKKSRPNVRTCINLLFILMTLAICFVCILNFYSVIQDNTVNLDVERGYGISVPTYEKDIIDTMNYIQLNVPIEDKIYVGNIHHDRLLSNSEIIYFLTERKSATKYSDIHPGVVTTQKVQNEIINELKKNNVEYIILYSGHENARKNESSGVKDLDIFIENNYSLVKIFGNYTIYKSTVDFTQREKP